MNILGIETSCDETAAAVVTDGNAVLSNVVYSQIAHHRPYGGVVPEIASRKHVEHLPAVIEEAMSKAGIGWEDLDAIAVTYGPGLASSLLVGLAAAKGLALRLRKPLVGINHLEAHIYSVFLGPESPDPDALSPLLALVVSGGHTCFVRMDGIGRYRLLGRTVDDAAGEAFDKGANLLKLGYPGGPVIDRTARDGNPKAVTFPRGFVRKLHSRITGLDPRLCVSFSGLKTALLYHLRDHPNLGSALKNQESGLTPATGAGNLEFQGLTPMGVADLAASYQEAIVDTLVQRATRIAESNTKVLAVVGGVSLNRRLREKMTDMAAKRRLQIVLAAPAYCTDNAAMVAGLAAHKLAACPPLRQAMLLDADPNLGIGEP